jgi:hypothetical protein
MAAVRDRPLSPHLTIWRWGPHMLVSILHRITGAGLTLVGLPILVWWLMAIAGGTEAYSTFAGAASHPAGNGVLVGLTWAFFQKAFRRHSPPADGHRNGVRAQSEQDRLDRDDRRVGCRDGSGLWAFLAGSCFQ